MTRSSEKNVVQTLEDVRVHASEFYCNTGIFDSGHDSGDFHLGTPRCTGYHEINFYGSSLCNMFVGFDEDAVHAQIQ